MMHKCYPPVSIVWICLLFIGGGFAPVNYAQTPDSGLVEQLEGLQEHTDSDVPYVPTNQAAVYKMLELANVTEDDVVYDLGSGDGRIVITAAKKYGAQGVGIEIDPKLVKQARENARQAGVSDLVSFKQKDLFETDLSSATVVTLYLLPELNRKLRPKLFKELQPGTPIISHDFDMGEWRPERIEQIKSDVIYLWTIPDEIPKHLEE